MNRAKKKKVLTREPAPGEINTANETAEPCPAPAPEPAPSLPSPPPAPEEETTEKRRCELTELTDRMESAIDDYAIVAKRWRKTIDTYFDNQEHWLWGATESERCRVTERLEAADDAVKAARHHYVECRRERKLFKMVQLLTIKMLLNPKKKALPRLVRMATRRLQEFRQRKIDVALETVQETESAFEVQGEVTRLIMKHFGAAVAWNWFPMCDRYGNKQF